MDTQVTNLDKVLENINIFGRYHLQLMFLTWFGYVTNGMLLQTYVFAVEESGYRCADGHFANNTCGKVDGSRCTEWLYDDPTSFVAEFQLACQNWKRALVGTVQNFGFMVGLFIIGPLSDRTGRKAALILTGLMAGVLGLIRSFSTSYWMFTVLAFLESVVGDCCLPLFILSLEIVTKKKRVIFSCLCQYGVPIGGILMPLEAWAVPYWRNFLRTIYSPLLLFIAYYFLIDESPRWLLTKGKKEKAIAVLEKMGDKNNVKLDRDELDTLLVKESSNSLNFADVMKMTLQSRVMLRRLFVCIVWWISSTFVNYGLTINSVMLQGNKYINYALTQIVDISGIFIMIYILNYNKRRTPLIYSFFAGAVLCFAQLFLPDEFPWLSITVYMVSKLMSFLFYNIICIYTSELFPTYTRNSMLAMCCSIGRIGAIIAPQMQLLMAYWSGLPTLIFACTSLVAGLVTFLVPDTADNSLPDTMQEAEDIGTCMERGVD